MLGKFGYAFIFINIVIKIIKIGIKNHQGLIKLLLAFSEENSVSTAITCFLFLNQFLLDFNFLHRY
ncbi:hypothetical protein JTT07_16400 [Clostridium botulinum]|nr:hypothetical protein CFSAN002369_15065 [Clostridium botulinum CFSAN002369]MCS4524923.1 hypothetical protein [Clostridium botulinum]